MELKLEQVVVDHIGTDHGETRRGAKRIGRVNAHFAETKPKGAGISVETRCPVTQSD